ncbi:MAG: hypothetical protein AAGL68_04090 [Pseudomonadota bacterium]
MRSADLALNELVLHSMEDEADEAQDEFELEQQYEDYLDEELEAEDRYYDDELGFNFDDEYEAIGGYDFEDVDYETYEGSGHGRRLTEAEVEQFASDLMSLETNEEAEEFLGKIFKGAKKLVKFARPLLAKAAPLVGAGIGSIIPGAGTAIGGIAGNALGSILGGGGSGGRRRSGGRRMRRGRRGRGRSRFNLGRALGGFLRGGGNPLSAVLQSGIGRGLLGRLMGREMEALPHAEVQFELAKRLVRTMDDVASDMSGHGENEFDFDKAASEAMARAVQRHIPSGVRPALLATRAA